MRPLYTSADLDGLDHLDTMPGLPPFLARSLRHDVRPASVDGAPVRRLFDGQRIQRLLSPQPGRGSEGAEHRVRSGDAPRLRLGSSACHRRRRHGRRGDRQHLRHANAVRRHSARSHERLDDDERGGAAGDGALHRRGGRAGREAGATCRHDSERHPQGVHGSQHVHLSARAEHSDHRRHLRVHQPADAEVQQHQHQRLSHAGSGRDGRPGTGLHAGRWTGVCPHGRASRVWTSMPSARGCRSSGRSA